jgi:GNAT superfamily N-acetyltransferase
MCHPESPSLDPWSYIPVVTSEPSGAAATIAQIPTRDWRDLRDARLRALAAEPDAFGTSWEADRQLTAAQWQETLTSNAWYRASADGASYDGIVALLLHDVEPDGAPQLGSMWVDPAHRHSGLARAMCTAVAEHARRAGARSLGLWLVVGNDAAERAYISFGFRYSGAEKPAPRDPSVVMRRMVVAL